MSFEFTAEYCCNFDFFCFCEEEDNNLPELETVEEKEASEHDGCRDNSPLASNDTTTQDGIFSARDTKILDRLVFIIVRAENFFHIL